MIIYTLYYYDKPFLEAWLNHYCHIPCIDEILIQNQNWSLEDSQYLYETVARYIDYYDVKIVVLPSQFEKIHHSTKRDQFNHYGQPTIRNRVLQFFKDATWIEGALDEALYGDSYPDTNRKLMEFEETALERAKEDKDTAGYFQLFSVIPECFRPGGEPTVHSINWKNRIVHNIHPVRHTGAPIHDNRLELQTEQGWIGFTPPSGHYSAGVDWKEWDVKLKIKLLHYHSLFRPEMNTVKFRAVERKDIRNWGEHPRHYAEKMMPE